jgi:hypothetical protein
MSANSTAVNRVTGKIYAAQQSAVAVFRQFAAPGRSLPLQVLSQKP